MSLKFLLPSLILGLLSISSYAGVSNEDPSVYLARRAFSRAKKPSKKDLYLNHRWVCGRYGAQPGVLSGTNAVELGAFEFESRGGEITNKNRLYKELSDFRSSNGDLRASYTLVTGGQGWISVRWLNGALLAEVSAARRTDSQMSSVSMPELAAIRYYYCTLFDHSAEDQAQRVYASPF